jgi:NodT family efflux transporter outer membrane factor (OMF) lipoprotein
MTRHSVRLAVLLAMLAGGVLAASCATRSPYVKPAPTSAAANQPGQPGQTGQSGQALPESFKEADGWKSAQPADQMLRGAWWESFGDAPLSQLEAQINISNENLKSADARFRQARALIRVNRAGLYPTVTTSPSIARSRGSANRPGAPAGGSHAGGDFTLPLDLSYEIDVWGRVRGTVDAARAAAQASAADLETVRLSLHAELALDYFELRSLDAQQQLLNDTVTAFQRALELTQNRYRGGIASGAEVAQAQTQLETTRAQAIEIGLARAQFEHAIAVLVGQVPQRFTLSAVPLASTPPGVPPTLPSQLLERRPDIAAAERRVAEANAQIGVARTAFFPTLLFNAGIGFESTSIGDWFAWPSRFWSIGPAAVQTIFDGGKRRAVSESARANYDATVADYRDTVLGAFQQVEDNLAALRILEQEAQTQRAAVEAAQRSVELSTNRYKGGLATYLEVVTAQSIALNNQRTAVGLLERRMTSTVLLIKALGGGWDASQLPALLSSTSAPSAKPSSAAAGLP